jgi:hypothetical protein
MRRLDDSAGQYKKVVQYEETFFKMNKMHTIKQSVKYTLSRIYDPNVVSLLMKLIFKTPIEDMPLFINADVIGESIIAKWRLELGK